MDNSERLPDVCTIVNTSLRDLFGTVDGFLYAPPTVSWCEAYLAGLPVLKYRGESLDIDWADALKIEALHVCSRESLKEGLQALLKGSSADLAENQTRLLKQAFSPVNEQVWLNLVGG